MGEFAAPVPRLPAALAVAGVLFMAITVHAAPIVGYDFEEGSGNTPADVFGNDNPGTFGGGASFVSPGAPANGGASALSVDGTTDGFVTIGNPGGILRSASGATLAAWINPDALPASGAANAIFVSNANVAGTQARANLQIQADGTIRAGGRSADSDGFQSATSPTGVIGTGAWSHIAAVFDYPNDTITLYLNGVQVDQESGKAFGAAMTSDTDSFAAAVGLRPRAAGFDERFDGQIDNVRIFNTALGGAEVAALVPEPASAGALALVGGALLLRRRRA